MTLNASGPISLAGTTAGQSAEVELGGNGTTLISMNDTNIRTLAGAGSSGTNWTMNALHGKSNVATPVGTIWSWGVNNYGGLADGTNVTKSSPVQINGGGTTWRFVAGGYQNGVALKSDNSLWTWGHGSAGQRADGVLGDTSFAAQIGGTSWKTAASGYYHVLAVTTTGSLFTWGRNNYGQLGDNTIVNKSSPVSIAGSTWASVAGGGWHSAAIKTDGTLWTWGRNNYGQLGNGASGATQSSPVQVSGTTWASVSCGYTFSAALRTDGTLWTWGRNDFGQLGDNTIVNKSSPVQVSGTWKSAVCGIAGYHMLGLKSDNTLWAWGYNFVGELGNNNSGGGANMSSPIQLAGTWSSIAAGRYHSAAIKSDGSLWNWGLGTSAQLGDNTTVNKSSPVQTIAAGTTWKFVAATAYDTYGIK